MSVSIDIGTSEVKLVELEAVNDNAVVSKIHCKSTWNDLSWFDPEKLEKSNWVACIDDICNDTKLNPKRIFIKHTLAVIVYYAPLRQRHFLDFYR